MPLGRQLRWVWSAERGRGGAWRAVVFGVVAAGCVAVVGWVGAGAPVAAASRDTTVGPGIHRTSPRKRAVALSPWEQADEARDALEAKPDEARTRAEYTRAMDAYRAIYHADPADVHAAAAVNAVAELLAEQGRTLHDATSLRAAVGQYEFLRTQYPASSLGVQALLAEGQVEQNDLHDAAAAREKYKLLLKQHARSEQAEEARAGLASLAQGTGTRHPETGETGQPVAARTRASGARPDGRPGGGGVAAAPDEERPAQPYGSARALGDVSARTLGASGREPSATNGVHGTVQGMRSGVSSLPATAQTARTVDAAPPTASARSATALAGDATALRGTPGSGSQASGVGGATARIAVAGRGAPGTAASGAAHGGRPALVTGIRHWSTATYTRVAIDLGDSVTYEAARVPNPDRIYFDLHGTRLAPELVGKSFAVTDDGFLKRVRAAQYSDDVTRVVLDVNDVTEYSAFLLPNPYRLIIDIHGGKGQGIGNREQGIGNREQGIGNREQEAVSANDVAAAPHAVGVANPTAARPDANGGATQSADASSEVADLSELPGRVDATSRPTSKPISAVVTNAGTREQETGNAEGEAAVADTTAANGALGPAAETRQAGSASSPRKTRKGRTKTTDTSTAVAADATPAREAAPTADGETSLVRALGLKIGRIVIDAGHGGHDSGTIGVDGIEEKDVVLDVALRLGKLLHDRLGAEIVYTRSDDTFIPLETRTAIANKAQADLFLSIHANSSPDASARGVETYYLNFTTDPTALDVAARENAVSDQSIHQLSDLVKKIALKDKIAESREFASDVEDSLYAGLQRGNPGLKDRGVKKAPFVVLIGANMPSILAEISFVTNPRDAEQLQQPEYRERVAESLYRGVARYEGGLSGTRMTTERAAVGQ